MPRASIEVENKNIIINQSDVIDLEGLTSVIIWEDRLQFTTLEDDTTEYNELKLDYSWSLKIKQFLDTNFQSDLINV